MPLKDSHADWCSEGRFKKKVETWVDSSDDGGDAILINGFACRLLRRKCGYMLGR